MPTILLTKGQRARVDWADYKSLAAHKWHASFNPENRAFYAVRTTLMIEGGKPHRLRMAREIMGLGTGKDDKRVVDHLNHDTLDNRRRNLRVCTQRQNCENRKDQSPLGPGVYRERRERSKPYKVMVRVDGQLHYLGNFQTVEDARQTRDHFLELIR